MKEIDELIDTVFVEKRFSGRSKSLTVTDSTLYGYIGEMPISDDTVDDSSGLFLLERFAQLRQKFFAEDLPKTERWCPLRGREMPDLQPISGEIPWTTMHTLPCERCGHAPDLHLLRGCTATVESPEGCGCPELVDTSSLYLDVSVYPCPECGHAREPHYEVGGMIECAEDDCNCGNNIGRKGESDA